MKKFRNISAVLIALTLTAVLPSAASAGTSTATFRGGSGFFLTSNGTDGLRQVSGKMTIAQSTQSSPITVNGNVSGLVANTLYVTVPYKDAVCLPTPGVTAFPSGTWRTDGNGSANVSVTVNPGAINPLASFQANQTRSVSIRQAIIPSIQLPGGILQTPTVPNAAPPETCDRNPVTG